MKIDPYYQQRRSTSSLLLYCRLISQSLAAFALTPKYVKGHFTLNSVFFLDILVENLLFPYTESAITSILGTNNIFGEGHTIGDMYKPEASKYSKTWNS